MCTSYKQAEINIIFWKENLLSSHLQVNAIGVTNGGGGKSSRKSAPKLSLNRLGLIQLLKAFPALCKPAIGKSCPLPGRQPPHMQLCFHSLCLASNLNQNLNISPTPIKALISEHLLHCALWAAFNAPESLPANASFFKPRPIAAFYPVFVPALSQAAMGGALPGPTQYR